MAIFLIVIGLQLGYNGATTGSVLGSESDITINTLLEQTNKERFLVNENPLSLNKNLNQAAYLKARDMFARQYWAHNAPDGTPPWKWFGDANYNYDEAGENLARDFTSTAAVMTAWMSSSKHRENITNKNYHDVGFAIVSGKMNDKPTSIVVAMYGLGVNDMIAPNHQKTFIGAVLSGQMNVSTWFLTIIQSITPVTMVCLSILLMALVVAALTHAYRRKLPKALYRTWYRYHGIYKVACLMAFVLIILSVYGAGKI